MPEKRAINQKLQQSRSGRAENAKAITSADRWARFKKVLAQPVSGASLAIFRMAVGLVMALEAFSLLRPSASTAGKVMLETYYTGADIKFHLPYALFEWLPWFPKTEMYAVVGLLAMGGLMMALGFFYRFAAVLVFLTWGYLYAVECTRTYWMSYYYLELLIAFLLIWMPAAREYSIDAWLFKSRPRTVPYWTVILLRGQLLIAYFYAGVAKLNSDWLLDAVPMRNFLANSRFLGGLHSAGLAYFLSYAGAIFDLSVGFLLLFRRTRTFAFVALVLFHATNHFVLFKDILWFPLLGIATATIFLDPDWPKRLGRKTLSVKLHGSPVPAASVGTGTLCFVIGWLAVQALIPIRQFIIPGDGRFTWEGLSFSWRLKTEIYSSSPCAISIHDSAIISRDSSDKMEVNWAAWHGDKVIYHEVSPEQIKWEELPEIVVLFEPEIGERIIYNPFAGSNTVRTEAESRARLNRIWQEIYSRQPETSRRTVPLSDIVDGYASALKNKGASVPATREETLALLLRTHGRAGNGQMIPFLRRVHPFGMQNASAVSAPFLVVEDRALFHSSAARLPEIDRAAWKSSDYARAKGEKYIQKGGEALVIHTPEIDLEMRTRLPQVCILESQRTDAEPVSISWDYLKDVPVSKGMHISTQPFLLRRYARRVATLWEKEYGRRPAVHARTAVSLNGRPAQLLVDPEADLASVSVTHWWHNPWIRDLELARIPLESLRK
jgi:vitamin K-dependent gamma-carboxylase